MERDQDIRRRSGVWHEAVVLCLVPPEIAGRVHEPLLRHYRDNPVVHVVVDRRGSERRAEEREAPGVERRAGRGRRAPLIRRGTMGLPRRIEPYADQLTFVQWMTPVHSRDEHASTHELVRRVSEGDFEAANELYWRYFERVYKRVADRLGRGLRAEEAVQDVFARAFEQLDDYRPSLFRGGSFEDWLHRLGADVAAERRHRRSRADAVSAA